MGGPFGFFYQILGVLALVRCTTDRLTKYIITAQNTITPTQTYPSVS